MKKGTVGKAILAMIAVIFTVANIIGLIGNFKLREQLMSTQEIGVSSTTTSTSTTIDVLKPGTGFDDKSDAPEGPVSTNFTVTSVKYPLIEDTQNTNPKDSDDLVIEFVSSTNPDEVRKLEAVCPLSFQGGAQFCVYVDAVTDVDNPYDASLYVSILKGVPGCSDFEECFEHVKGQPYCKDFLDYLDNLTRELVSNGYNSDGLINLDPSQVVASYWDPDGRNRMIEFKPDCSVVVTQL